MKSTKQNKPVRGRPKSDNPRISGFVLRLTPGELKTITAKAKSMRKVRAEWVRETLLAA